MSINNPWQATDVKIHSFDRDRRYQLVLNKFYFWDETGDFHGPYETYAIACDELEIYGNNL